MIPLFNMFLKHFFFFPPCSMFIVFRSQLMSCSIEHSSEKLALLKLRVLVLPSCLLFLYFMLNVIIL